MYQLWDTAIDAMVADGFDSYESAEDERSFLIDLARIVAPNLNPDNLVIRRV